MDISDEEGIYYLLFGRDEGQTHGLSHVRQVLYQLATPLAKFILDTGGQERPFYLGPISNNSVGKGRKWGSKDGIQRVEQP